MDFTDYDSDISIKPEKKLKKKKHKTKRSRTHSSTCVSLREKGSKDEKDTCAALIGHGQTMYSACFILSRFINVNIFRLPRSHSPFIPSPYPGPFSRDESDKPKIN